MQNTLQQISIYGRLLGAVFYYEPNDARLTDILTFFRQPNWMQEWEISFDVKTHKKSPHLLKKGCNKISLNNISIYLLVQMNYLRHLGDLYILILNVLFLVILS